MAISTKCRLECPSAVTEDLNISRVPDYIINLLEISRLLIPSNNLKLKYFELFLTSYSIDDEWNHYFWNITNTISEALEVAVGNPMESLSFSLRLYISMECSSFSSSFLKNVTFLSFIAISHSDPNVQSIYESSINKFLDYTPELKELWISPTSYDTPEIPHYLSSFNLKHSESQKSLKILRIDNGILLNLEILKFIPQFMICSINPILIPLCSTENLTSLYIISSSILTSIENQFFYGNEEEPSQLGVTFSAPGFRRRFRELRNFACSRVTNIQNLESLILSMSSSLKHLYLWNSPNKFSDKFFQNLPLLTEAHFICCDFSLDSDTVPLSYISTIFDHLPRLTKLTIPVDLKQTIELSSLITLASKCQESLELWINFDEKLNPYNDVSIQLIPDLENKLPKEIFSKFISDPISWIFPYIESRARSPWRIFKNLGIPEYNFAYLNPSLYDRSKFSEYSKIICFDQFWRVDIKNLKQLASYLN